jgi:membrane-associated phospholipid phosphatase
MQPLGNSRLAAGALFGIGTKPSRVCFRVSDGLGRATSRSRLRHSLDHVPRRWRRVLGCKIQLWMIRAFQADPDVKTVFPTPNHPSYPAAHGCFSTASAAVLGYLFPRDAVQLAALAEEANQSRIATGIHYRSDTVAGRELGLAVAGKAIARASRTDRTRRTCHRQPSSLDQGRLTAIMSLECFRSTARLRRDPCGRYGGRVIRSVQLASSAARFASWRSILSSSVSFG